MIVLLFGAPGCGKGTQASFIAKRYSIPAISTGEMFRAECRLGTSVGKAVCELLASGCLLGDEVVNPMVAARIGEPDCSSGFLLDGYPRTVPQASFLAALLRERRMPQPIVIHLDVPLEVVAARLSARRQCPQCSRVYNLTSQRPRVEGICDQDGAVLVRRDDDRDEVIRERLNAYESLTGPVLSWYGPARCHRVDGTRPPAVVSAEIAVLLGSTPPVLESGGQFRRLPAP